MSAVAKGNLGLTQQLLKNKTIDINAKDPQSGVNSFWLACLYGHGTIMRELANNGADILVTNKRQINSLHLAIYKNHFAIAKMLIKSGFPLDRETSDGLTALHLSAHLHREDIVDEILSYLGESGFKKSYISKIINKINPKTNLSAISMAILVDDRAIAMKLITFGAKCFLNENKNQMDLSPIFLACQIEDT